MLESYCTNFIIKEMIHNLRLTVISQREQIWLSTLLNAKESKSNKIPYLKSGGHYELSCMNDMHLIMSIHYIQGKNTFDFKYTRENEFGFSLLGWRK